MPYNPTTDLVGLWRAVSGGVEKAEIPGVDFMVAALTRAGLMRTVTSQTAPTTNQSTTAWFRPANPSYASEGSLFLWDPSLSMYVPATPELFHGGSSGGGGDGGGGSDMAIISGTAPPNPTAGQQWWNGSIMQVWDGTSWKTVSGGTSALVFAVSQSATMTLTANTWTIAPLTGVPQVDTMSGWDPVTKKYTPKTAGYYTFAIRGFPSVTPPGEGAIALLKNDDGVFENTAGSDIVITATTSTSTTTLSTTGFAQMNGTTDYVRYFGYSKDGSMIGTGPNPIFSVLRLP